MVAVRDKVIQPLGRHSKKCTLSVFREAAGCTRLCLTKPLRLDQAIENDIKLGLFSTSDPPRVIMVFLLHGSPDQNSFHRTNLFHCCLRDKDLWCPNCGIPDIQPFPAILIPIFRNDCHRILGAAHFLLTSNRACH
ncbi:hypothetical protein AVEN_135235-1 [Araneus ventricosus]|uniref:Uncharacterized protein n=1 Tax=Araneus ventricosus TaxID=182803 RepID=A0A4Y2CPL9_ARAVE|nr:hypothetical protein AVEN_135235-1 [Araneus ventricosus]